MFDVFTKPAGTDEVVRYESKTVRAVRGTEARTIAKWQKDGWELDTQTQASVLRTEITFRRRRRSTPQWQRWAMVGGAILFALVIAIGVLVENLGGGGTSGSTAPSTEAAAPTSGRSAETPAQDVDATQSGVAPAPSAVEETLTVENNPDLAALLALPAPEAAAVPEFAATYRGRTIEFDANIAAMDRHGDYDTRFDILISAGDYSETTMTGPNFQFRDVNITSDLGLTGPNIPDFIGARTNLHIVAEVVGFESATGLFILEPVSTQVR